MVSSIKLNEICKVRTSSLGLGGAARTQSGRAYTWAVFKKANKATARVVIVDDTFDIGTTLYTVPFGALWKQKAAVQKKIDTKIAKATLNSLQTLDEDEAPGEDTSVPWQKPVQIVKKIDGLDCVAEAKVTGKDTLLTLVHGSVTDFTGDAIVNAANEGCLGGGGIDGRICDLGGPVLAQARRALPVLSGGDYGKRCDTGDAKITVSGNLPCEWVIHAVGPQCSYCPPFDGDLKLLADAYKNALLRAEEKKLRKVAFCIISAGIFRGGCSLKTIIETGLKSIADNSYNGLDRVFFCGFTNEEKSLISSTLGIEEES